MAEETMKDFEKELLKNHIKLWIQKKIRMQERSGMSLKRC